jgi:phosphoadenosine phosphosulfate reductase
MSQAAVRVQSIEARVASNAAPESVHLKLFAGETPLPMMTPEKLEPTEVLLAELRAKSDELETAAPREILAWAAERFAPRFTMATAFGPEGMVLLHLLAEVAPKTPIFNLETGYQFQPSPP